MLERFDPMLGILPPALRAIWSHLGPTARLGYVLYGGTALTLQLGHRQSADFDFFRDEQLDKDELRRELPILDEAVVLRNSPDTLVVLAPTGAGEVKLSFFGGLRLGRIHDPLQTSDGILLVASLEDILATKLKATQDRAEARDYRDIAELLRAGVDLPRGLAAFRQMFKGGEPAEVLRALGFFADGDLASVSPEDRIVLTTARDNVRDLPPIELIRDSAAISTGGRT